MKFQKLVDMMFLGREKSVEMSPESAVELVNFLREKEEVGKERIEQILQNF